ncbi:MAG: Na+/H+ antiporter [Solirubrobacterales bacterium]|nr:Na+/H+ antiporter [Solirubrobacterales bacterium]
MHGELVVLGVLLAAGAFLVVAARSVVPYPILMVAGGSALAFLPGASEFELEPEVVLLAFLPPLLYSAAFFSSLQDLRANVRAIGLLAVGMVTVTMCSVAVVAHAVIPDMSWEAAFVLGAVVSPTDPVAAVEIATRVRAPRRLITIVEGESLINDSTGLIAYKFAVAAAASGAFSLSEALGEFVLSAVAGVGIGLAVGYGIRLLRRSLDDAPTEIAISLITPYLAYLPAEVLGVSAVLAAVVSGLYLGWYSPELVTPSTRIQAYAFWEVFVFALNATLFVLIGIQLHVALEALQDRSAADLAIYGAAITAAVMLTRLLFVFPLDWIGQRIPTRGEPDRDHDPRLVGLIGWTGMRGAVSLAAALAIPLETDAGAPFPDRDLIIFLAWTVIAVTIILPGLTLPKLIEVAGVYDDEETVAEQEARARIAAADAALARLDELGGEDWVRDETHARMRGAYDFRKRRFEARLDDGDDGQIEQGSQAYQRLRREVLQAERAEIVRQRNRGLITDEIMRRIERDLDLEDARLEI